MNKCLQLKERRRKNGDEANMQVPNGFGRGYLSDYQGAVFAGRGAHVVFAFVVDDHSLHRLRLAVTQPRQPAREKTMNSWKRFVINLSKLNVEDRIFVSNNVIHQSMMQRLHFV